MVELETRVLLILIVVGVVQEVANGLSDPICLTGIYHKSKPGPEGPNYKACHMFKNSSCCTAAFTGQLSGSPILKIGNFSWVQCGQKKLSRECEKYMINVECFYQCSPNVGYWKGQYKGSFTGAPVCSTFCDKWFEACKDDLTCAANWITGFNTSSTGENRCRETCRKFSAVYTNGKGLCEGMWGSSFKYQQSKTPYDCMRLDFGNFSISDNFKVVEKYFASSAVALQPLVLTLYTLLLVISLKALL